MTDFGQNPIFPSDLSRVHFHNAETNRIHNSYDHEVREVASIERGDVEELKKILDEPLEGRLGVLADHPLRSWKNLAIVVITLASRAAIRGGLSAEEGYTMSDFYINELERQTSPEAVYALLRRAELLFAAKVHELCSPASGPQSEKNPCIRRCKDYIYSHLHDHLTVQSVADSLHVNRDYLSRLFRESEGLSLSRYILNEKLERAKNLLIYSDYTYSEIASYLGFSSQSHLGVRFKRHTGCTLKEYRTRYFSSAGEQPYSPI